MQNQYRPVPLRQAARAPSKVRRAGRDGSSEELDERLARSDLDVAIYGCARRSTFNGRWLYDERFVIGVCSGHAFDKQGA